MSRDLEEQFDFQDQPKKNNKNSKNSKNNKAPYNNQFDDLEDEEKNVKLPAINNKNAIKNGQQTQKKNPNVNLQQITKKKLDSITHENKEYEEQYGEQFQQPIAEVETPKKSHKQEQLKKSNKSKPIAEKEQQHNEYGEQAFEQQEEQQYLVNNSQKNKKQSPSPLIYKGKDQINEQSQNKLKPSKTIEKATNKTEISKLKNQTNTHQISRNSARSQSKSRTIEVKSRVQQKKQQAVTSKYVQLVQKSCPDHDKKYLQELNMDKLVRQNDKVRGLIKKLNDQLNDLINKNIMQLKNKKEDKVTVLQDTLKVFQQQKINNQATYQITVKQLQRLKNKQGQLKDQEFQLQLQANISETKTSIAQFSKVLTKIGKQINNQGIKLLKIDKENTVLQDVNNVKNNLANAKKEQEKNEENMKKLDLKHEELDDKINGMESKIKMLVDDASNKGYSIANNPQFKKKAEELKRKIEIGKLHKIKTQALFKTKSQFIVHESDQFRNQIKLNDKIIQIAVNNCEETQLQGKKLVEKARKSGRLTNQFITTLESIIAQMENPTKNQSRQSQDSKMNYPKGSKKYQSVKNVQKILINTKPSQEKQQILLKKPIIFKKKQKDQEQEGAKERVWKYQKDKQVQKKKNEQFAKFQDRETQKKDEEKKKPFVIKKNRQSRLAEGQIPSSNQSRKQDNYQLPLQIKKDDSQTASIAPRLMKFKKNKPQDQQNAKVAQENIEKKAVIPVIQQKKLQKSIQEEETINIVPKRFNLKLKDKKNEESGYIASIVEKKQEQKPIQKPVQEYKPKGINVQKQPVFTIQLNKQSNLISKNLGIQAEQEEKPKFNLRLRDRQKQSNKLLQPKIQIPQQSVSKSPQSSIIANTAENGKSQNNVSKQNNPYTNPYANNANPIKKQREGPIKKQKPAQSIEKKSFNIYEQAQDIRSNVNEINIHKEQPTYVNKPISNDEPDLNKLLGIEKKNVKNQLHQDLLVDNKNIQKKEKKIEVKNDTNFFGDLQL